MCIMFVGELPTFLCTTPTKESINCKNANNDLKLFNFSAEFLPRSSLAPGESAAKEFFIQLIAYLW